MWKRKRIEQNNQNSIFITQMQRVSFFFVNLFLIFKRIYLYFVYEKRLQSLRREFSDSKNQKSNIVQLLWKIKWHFDLRMLVMGLLINHVKNRRKIKQLFYAHFLMAVWIWVMIMWSYPNILYYMYFDCLKKL